MVIKTARLSARIGLHDGLKVIRQEKITAALITRANLIHAPGLTISLSVLGSLLPEGSSKSLDASADKYAGAEAVSAVYASRLNEALRDGTEYELSFELHQLMLTAKPTKSPRSRVTLMKP